MIGTGKLIKHMRMPVYCVNIKGGYMSNTQWNIAVRSGKVVATLDKLFTPEEIDNLSPEEIERKSTKPFITTISNGIKPCALNIKATKPSQTNSKNIFSDALSAAANSK